MGTFTSKVIVDEIIARNGAPHPEDPQDGGFNVVKIVQYTTPEGDSNNWGVVYAMEIGLKLANRYDTESTYIRNPKVVWINPKYT